MIREIFLVDPYAHAEYIIVWSSFYYHNYAFAAWINAVSAIPTSITCAVYDEETEALQIIENTWNEVVCCVWKE